MEDSSIIPLTVLKKFLATKKIEYLVLDCNLTIKSLSAGVEDYSDYPEMLKLGSKGVNAFPELIGLEEICEKLIQGDCSSFEMKWLARSVNPKRPEYINFYILAGESERLCVDNNKFLFVLFEKSELVDIHQQLLS